jgi:hypothetical protein
MTLGQGLLYPIAFDSVAGPNRLRQIQTPGFMLPKRIKMASRFFVVGCHGVESHSCPKLPALFVMIFLLSVNDRRIAMVTQFLADGDPQKK